VLGARRCLGPGLRRGDDVKRLVILISGRGSNMAALIDAVRAGEIDAAIGTVISNRPDAAGLGIAAAAGVATSVVDHRAFADRGEFERSLIAAIDAKAPDLVVLAGFMRILSPAFVTRYAGRLLNIHPSLLPAYPGVDTHRRALADCAGRARAGGRAPTAGRRGALVLLRPAVDRGLSRAHPGRDRRPGSAAGALGQGDELPAVLTVQPGNTRPKPVSSH
jgi:formyltetrahydrofolate-dependent phosphoribosylglycinamide formyltransferase